MEAAKERLWTHSPDGPSTALPVPAAATSIGETRLAGCTREEQVAEALAGSRQCRWWSGEAACAGCAYRVVVEARWCRWTARSVGDRRCCASSCRAVAGCMKGRQTSGRSVVGEPSLAGQSPSRLIHFDSLPPERRRTAGPAALCWPGRGSSWATAPAVAVAAVATSSARPSLLPPDAAPASVAAVLERGG